MAHYDRLSTQTGHAGRSSTPHSRRRWLLLPVLSIAVVAIAACGVGVADGSSNGAAQQGAVVDGNTLTWSPPWQTGDVRNVTVQSSSELNPEAQALLKSLAESEKGSLPGDLPGGMFDPQDIPGMNGAPMPVSGKVRFIQTGPDGATAEYSLSFQDILSQMGPDQLSDDDMAEFRGMLALVSQLDLALQVNVNSEGAITEVTNLDDIAQTMQSFITSFMSLAGQQDGSSPIKPEDKAKIESALQKLPQTDLVQQAALAAVYDGSGQLFLMREGEYTVGEPVTVSGEVPSITGLMTQGKAVYNLTSVSGTQATMKVEVTPGKVDLAALLNDFATQAKDIFGSDGGEMQSEIPEITPEQQQALDAASDMLFQPYTVTLTIDTSTGWVTGADWQATFTVPQQLVDSGDLPEGAENAAVTMTFHSAISEGSDQ